MLLSFIASGLIYSGLSYKASAQVDFDSTTSANYQNFSVKVADQSLLENPACQDFINYSKNEMNTFGVVVLKGGKPVLEFYNQGSDATKKYKLWSISKTFSGLMLGTLVQQNKLSLDSRVADFLPASEGDKDKDPNFRKDLTVRHLWTMSSGIDWCEYTPCAALDALKLMYGLPRADSLNWVWNRGLNYPPGEVYTYSSGNAVMLQSVFKKLLGNNAYQDLPLNIFTPLQITDWAIEQDDANLYMGGSGLSLNTRDFSKLGQLIVQKGVWKGKTLFPKSFYTEMVTPSHAIQSPLTPDAIKSWEGPVGGSIWLNQIVDGVPQFFKTAPQDMIYGGGKFGQFLLIFPDTDPAKTLVVARNGGDENHSPYWEPFTNRALKCFAPDKIQIPTDRPDPKPPETDPEQRKKAVAEILHDRLPVNMLAQEHCNCRFVGGFKTVDECKKFFPSSETGWLFPRIVVDEANSSVSAYTTFGVAIGSKAVAAFDKSKPHLGCKVTVRAQPLTPQDFDSEIFKNY
jgi:CubicO group peptidase (beta-lactamase class C family)